VSRTSSPALLRAAPRRRPVLTALLLTAALTGQACSVTGTRTAQPAGHSDTSQPAPNQRSTLAWSACDSGFECATLRVPLDYARPTGPTLSLAIARHRAAKPAERIGSLLMNPGGPGGSAIDLIEHDPLSGELTDRFDIVGFDPRGVGRSSPLNCHSHLQEMYDADSTIETPADRSHYLAVSRAFVDECRRKYATVLPYLGTRNVARDMDQVRQALGDKQLTYVGYSYGTSIGEQYANLFPTHIRAMVLDGVVNSELTGLQAAGQQADGFERELDAFLNDCASRSSCQLTGTPSKVLDQVIASAERRPIPAPDADRPASSGLVELALSQGLYAKALWPQLASAIADAHRGDGSGIVDLANDYLQRRPDGSYPNLFEVYFAVNCLDSSWPRAAGTILAAAKAVGKRDPRLGEGLVNDYVRCALWPARPQPLPRLNAPRSPPILVISTTGDPATPYASGVAVAARLPKGVLLTNVGDGHTAFGQGKPCVDDAVMRYLLTLEPPPNGLRCP
jgi:pimeloyl-ACP methyl ester carboxylesterase